MDAKERLEKIKIIAQEKIRIYDIIDAKDSRRSWEYVYDLITNDSWLNNRYDYYTLSEKEYDEKYPELDS